MQIENTSGPYQELDVQALAIAVFKDEKADDGFLNDLDAITGGVIKSVIESEELKGKEGETVYLHLMNNNDIKAQRLLLVGVGDRAEYTTAQAAQMAGTATRVLRGKNAKSISIVPRLEGNAEEIGSVVVEGAIMGLFEPDKYRTSDKEERIIERLVVVIDGAD